MATPPGEFGDSLERESIRVVLVRARNPNNIGAVARAMHDFGFHDLRLVGDYRAPFEGAASAVDASSVLASATFTESMAEAVAGCTLVCGTSAVGERDVLHPLHGLMSAASLIRAQAGSGRVALLFGSEKTGLSNEELSFCDLLLTIPMQQYESMRHPSMNLGQAVAVCLWELVRPGVEPPVLSAANADAAEIERVHGLLTQVLEETEYTRRHAATADAAHIRRLVHRMSLQQADVPAWLGILRQILWKVRPTSGC